MTVLQARLILLAFVGVSAAITYNALFRQAGPHPAPYAKETVQPQSKPRSQSVRASAPALSSPAADTVRAVQRELAQRGYEPGPVDGVAGAQTRAAIMAYQHDKGLPVTGAASGALLEHVVLGQSAARLDEAVPEETTRLIKAVQQTLAELGYGPGPVDGIMGAATRRAIENFERERGLPVTGRISGRLVGEMVRITGASLDRVP